MCAYLAKYRDTLRPSCQSLSFVHWHSNCVKEEIAPQAICCASRVEIHRSYVWLISFCYITQYILFRNVSFVKVNIVEIYFHAVYISNRHVQVVRPPTWTLISQRKNKSKAKATSDMNVSSCSHWVVLFVYSALCTFGFWCIFPVLNNDVKFGEEPMVCKPLY